MKASYYTLFSALIYTTTLLSSPILLAQAVNIESSTVNAQIEVLDEFQAEQARLKNLVANRPAAYIDKVMSTEPANDAIIEDDSKQPEGVRSYFLESRMYSRTSDNSQQTKSSNQNWSLQGEYRQQTLNYGEWMVQGEIRNQENNRVELTAPISYNRQKLTNRKNFIN